MQLNKNYILDFGSWSAYIPAKLPVNVPECEECEQEWFQTELQGVTLFLSVFKVHRGAVTLPAGIDAVNDPEVNLPTWMQKV